MKELKSVKRKFVKTIVPLPNGLLDFLFANVHNKLTRLMVNLVVNAYLKKPKNEVEYDLNSWDQKLDHGYIEGY